MSMGRSRVGAIAGAAGVLFGVLAAAWGGKTNMETLRDLLREPILERRVEEQLAPAATRRGADRGELLARTGDRCGVQGESALPDAHRVEDPRALR